MGEWFSHISMHFIQTCFAAKSAAESFLADRHGMKKNFFFLEKKKFSARWEGGIMFNFYIHAKQMKIK